MKIPANYAFLDRAGTPRPVEGQEKIIKAMYRDCPCGHCGKLGVKMELVGFLVENRLKPIEDGGALVFNLIRCFHCNGRLDQRGEALQEDGEPVTGEEAKTEGGNNGD